MHPELVARFNALVERTGAKIVLSSTWRLSDTWRKDMRENGLHVEHFIDRTPRMPHPPDAGAEYMERGKEIQAWLEKYTEPVEAYAIIDDDSDMLPDQPHFKTSFYDGGLTQEIAEQIEKHLTAVMHT